MNTFLTFIGEYSWGLIHPIVRDVVFWVLLVVGIVMAIIFLVNFRKSKPSGRKIPPGLEHRPGYQDEHAKQVKHKKEVATAKMYAIIAALLLFFPLVKVAGMMVYADEMETSVEKMPVITIPLGQSVTRNGKEYTCSKGTQGNAFTYQPNPGSLAVETGVMLVDVTPATKLFKATWWGAMPHSKKTELTYVCKS